MSDDHVFAVHSPAGTNSECDAVLFSVGTAMKVEGYTAFADKVTSHGLVAVVVDPQTGSPTKLDAEAWTSAMLYVKENLLTWTTCGSIRKWIMGGHSAGGAAAHESLLLNPSMADKIFSVDPFPRGDFAGNVELPALYWGFDHTTCFVKADKAAKEAYLRTTNEERAYIRVHNHRLGGVCGTTFNYHHCSISDEGCKFCSDCGGSMSESTYKDDVALSLAIFISSGVQQLSTQSWTTPAARYVGSAEP